MTYLIGVGTSWGGFPPLVELAPLLRLVNSRRSAFFILSKLWSIVAHVVQCPSILNDKKWYPLRLVIDGKHDGSKNQGSRVYNKKQNIKKFLMAGPIFVIGYI